MMTENARANRLYASVCAEAGEEKANILLSDLPLPKSPSEKQKAEWAARSCEALTRNFGADAARVQKGCHCKPPAEAIKRLAHLWAEKESLADFAARATGGGAAFYEENGALIQEYPRCYCAFVKRAPLGAPALWCQCSVGYTEYLFARVTGRPVRAELLQSVAAGAPACRIRILFE